MNYFQLFFFAQDFEKSKRIESKDFVLNSMRFEYYCIFLHSNELSIVFHEEKCKRRTELECKYGSIHVWDGKSFSNLTQTFI